MKPILKVLDQDQVTLVYGNVQEASSTDVIRAVWRMTETTPTHFRGVLYSYLYNELAEDRSEQ